MPYEGVSLVHGSPADEDEYLFSPYQLPALHPFLESQVTFFGHTHVQGGFLMAPRGSRPIARHVILNIEPDYFYLVNPGSVGQPRDADPRAAYALYSPQERTVEFRRAAYDVDRAAAKIRAAGLPEFLAARLHEGRGSGPCCDPDGRGVSLQAPLPAGVIAPDADSHHREKYA